MSQTGCRQPSFRQPALTRIGSPPRELFKEPVGLDPEGLGQPMYHQERGVTFAALDSTDIGSVDSGLGSEFLLRQARCFAEPAHGCAEDNAFGPFFHSINAKGCYLTV